MFSLCPLHLPSNQFNFLTTESVVAFEYVWIISNNILLCHGAEVTLSYSWILNQLIILIGDLFAQFSDWSEYCHVILEFGEYKIIKDWKNQKKNIKISNRKAMWVIDGQPSNYLTRQARKRTCATVYIYHRKYSLHMQGLAW